MTIRAGYSLTVNTQFYHLFVGMWTRPHAWLCCALPPHHPVTASILSDKKTSLQGQNVKINTFHLWCVCFQQFSFCQTKSIFVVKMQCLEKPFLKTYKMKILKNQTVKSAASNH